MLATNILRSAQLCIKTHYFLNANYRVKNVDIVILMHANGLKVSTKDAFWHVHANVKKCKSKKIDKKW